jgi:hypothetical protein
MPGQFINSPDLVGKSYKEVADYPYDKPIAQDGNRFVYKGIRKVYLVQNGQIIDFFDWEKFGNQYRYVQKKAQETWGIRWLI